MGKVFNDQIIKFLCAKKLNKIQNEIGEPQLVSKDSKCSKLRRGESYVVFLNRKQRKDLQRQLDLVDYSLKASKTAMDPSICALELCDTCAADGVQTWINTRLNQQSSQSNRKNFKTRIQESLHSLGMFMQRSISAVNLMTGHYTTAFSDKIHTTPAIFGPFMDEPICSSIDKLYYFTCLVFGRDLGALESVPSNK